MTNQYAENGQICNKNILNIFTKKIWTFVLHPPIHRSPKKTVKKAKSWLPLWFGHPGCEKWFSNHQMIAITVSNYCSPTARRSGFWVLMGFCVVLNMTWCEIVLPWCGFVRYCGCCGIVFLGYGMKLYCIGIVWHGVVWYCACACACDYACALCTALQCLLCCLWVWQISSQSRVWVAGTGPNCFITLLYNPEIFIRACHNNRMSSYQE